MIFEERPAEGRLHEKGRLRKVARKSGKNWGNYIKCTKYFWDFYELTVKNVESIINTDDVDSKSCENMAFFIG